MSQGMVGEKCSPGAESAKPYSVCVCVCVCVCVYSTCAKTSFRRMGCACNTNSKNSHFSHLW